MHVLCAVRNVMDSQWPKSAPFSALAKQGLYTVCYVVDAYIFTQTFIVVDTSCCFLKCLLVSVIMLSFVKWIAM